MSAYRRPILKNKRVRSKKITQSANGELCTLRIPGVCNSNPETTVFAHMNGGGMGYKHHDIHGCYACSSCHDLIDARISYGDEFIKAKELLRAMIETQNKLIQKGLINI